MGDDDLTGYSGGEDITGRAYDTLAPRYDELAQSNAILAHVANVSSELVRKNLAGCRQVLDIGCGTGREAIMVAQEGKQVVACDPSAVSLRILEEKAAKLNARSRIVTRQLKASELNRLEAEFGLHAFDGVYSSFALSYEPELAPIARQVARLVETSSPFLCSIFNRYCLLELLLLAPILLPRKALRRLLGKTSLPVDRYEVCIWSRSASEVIGAFKPNFRPKRMWALPAILPPHYLHLIVDLLGEELRVQLERLDRRFNGAWPFRTLGSHTAYMFEAI